MHVCICNVCKTVSLINPSSFFSPLRTLWLWGKQTTMRWSSSGRSSTRLWERAGPPKWTGWPTTWPKTTAPRERSPSQVRGRRSGGKECTGGERCAKETRWKPSWLEEGNPAEYLKHKQPPPQYTVQLPFLSVSLWLGASWTSNPKSWSGDISVESWWV